MNKPWLSSYPPHVPAEIDLRGVTSLVTLAQRACQRFADRAAFTSLGVTLGFAEFDRLTRDFAAHLQRALGPCMGERIALMLPNSLQYPVAVFGALRAGMAVVNVNPLYTASELGFQLRDSGAVAIVVLENFAHTLSEALPGTAVRHVVVTQIGDLFPAPRRALVNFVVRRFKRPVTPWSIAGAVSLHDALDAGADALLEEVALTPADPAFVQYTGGTTGRPKGALLSHGNLVANVLQTTAWVGGALVPRPCARRAAAD